jgi:hypothetical protein
MGGNDPKKEEERIESEERTDQKKGREMKKKEDSKKNAFMLSFDHSLVLCSFNKEVTPNPRREAIVT